MTLSVGVIHDGVDYGYTLSILRMLWGGAGRVDSVKREV